MAEQIYLLPVIYIPCLPHCSASPTRCGRKQTSWTVLSSQGPEWCCASFMSRQLNGNPPPPPYLRKRLRKSELYLSVIPLVYTWAETKQMVLSCQRKEERSVGRGWTLPPRNCWEGRSLSRGSLFIETWEGQIVNILHSPPTAPKQQSSS